MNWNKFINFDELIMASVIVLGKQVDEIKKPMNILWVFLGALFS